MKIEVEMKPLDAPERVCFKVPIDETLPRHLFLRAPSVPMSDLTENQVESLISEWTKQVWENWRSEKNVRTEL